MAKKTRFAIRTPGRSDIGCNTADEVLDRLDELKDVKGLTVADLQTGMSDLTREEVVNLANAERE